MPHAPRLHLPPAVLDVVRDLLRDARATYRHVRQDPHRPDAADLVAYADMLRVKAGAIRSGRDFRLNKYGWPEILPRTWGHPDAPRA
jgi:hypothetical protein